MKILLGTDGSSHALAAARFLAHRVPRGHTRVDLVRVIPPERQRRQGRNGKLEEGSTEDISSWIDQTDWPLTVRGFDVRRIRKTGTPTRVLTELAVQGGYDLVVVGAKGTSDTAFHDVGNVALSLLEHSPVPVLVVRKDPFESNGNGRRHSDGRFRVLVPTDGKAQSHEAVLGFLSLFPHLPAELVVTTGVDDIPDEMLGHMSPSELRRFRGYMEGVAEARLKDMMNRLEPHGRPVEVRRVSGPPAKSIVAAAKEEGADLVVIGSRSVRNTAERHLGGVGGEVARSAPCSVLVVRDRGVDSREERPRTRATTHSTFRTARAPEGVRRHA